MTLIELAKNSKNSAQILAETSAEQKKLALQKMAEQLHHNRNKIIEINKIEVALAKQNLQNTAFIDRLTLTENTINGMIDGIKKIAELKDPVGRILSSWEVASGLKISRVAIPLGVIAVIYESRPNVTADAAALCLKSGNAVILRGGSECAKTNQAIAECLQQGLIAANLPKNLIQYLPTQDRAAIDELLQLDQYIDVIIPRGGKNLIQRIRENSKIPVFSHLDGNCHTYVHEDADLEKAIKIVVNAKMRRTGICGATETLLVDAAIAKSHLPKILQALQEKGCEIRGDALTQKMSSNIKPATELDWQTEYLDAIIAVRVVDNIDQAIAHIQEFGSNHTEAIITENKSVAQQFQQRVNSAIVMHNCSTQFADGGEFGMGAEIGIATGKLHARGPVGVEQLTTFKYIVEGSGQIRS